MFLLIWVLSATKLWKDRTQNYFMFFCNFLLWWIGTTGCTQTKLSKRRAHTSTKTGPNMQVGPKTRMYQTVCWVSHFGFLKRGGVLLLPITLWIVCECACALDLCIHRNCWNFHSFPSAPFLCLCYCFQYCMSLGMRSKNEDKRKVVQFKQGGTLGHNKTTINNSTHVDRSQ